jgi:NAD(P)-dependent dehydrogenase (short-subunit alcohol dehydrogenase family)
MAEKELNQAASAAPTLSNRLSGRRLVVTGGASGIGRAVARLFAAEGASLALLDRDARVAETAREIGANSYVVDITNESAVMDVIEQAGRAMSGIDGVVNAAGIMSKGLTTEVPADDWRRILEVNLTGTYIVVRSCLPWMQQEEEGTIVNIASAAGLLSNAPGLTAYAASKGGVIALSRVLAAELAPKIRVNSVCPGMVDTPMADGYRANVGNYALKRLADPLEIARAILFLTASDSSYVTGAALATDGGRSFH